MITVYDFYVTRAEYCGKCELIQNVVIAAFYSRPRYTCLHLEREGADNLRFQICNYAIVYTIVTKPVCYTDTLGGVDHLTSEITPSSDPKPDPI